MNQQIKFAYQSELNSFRKSLESHDWSSAWNHIERAHVLGQYFVIPHLETHWHMLSLAVKTSDLKEALAQIPRLLLAAPGSLTRKAPKGNPGTGRVGIFTPTNIPEDLAKILNS